MPAGIVAIVIAFVVGYFALSQAPFSFFGGGPIASGPRTTEVKNPEPAPSDNRGFAHDDGAGFPAGARLPGESQYKGSIRISTVERFSNSPDREYLVLRYANAFAPRSLLNPGGLPAAIDVTGWRIENAHSSAVIPQAVAVPEVGFAPEDIRLEPGGSLVVLSGTPAYPQNFRENQCTGYLSQSFDFTPPLSLECRDASSDASALLRRGFKGACVDLIRSSPACRAPQGPFQAGIIGVECTDFIHQSLNYSGCVRDFRDRKDFLKNIWRVFLGRTAKFYDPQHDRIIVRDRQGLVVDEFEY